MRGNACQACRQQDAAMPLVGVSGRFLTHLRWVGRTARFSPRRKSGARRRATGVGAVGPAAGSDEDVLRTTGGRCPTRRLPWPSVLRDWWVFPVDFLPAADGLVGLQGFLRRRTRRRAAEGHRKLERLVPPWLGRKMFCGRLGRACCPTRRLPWPSVLRDWWVFPVDFLPAADGLVGPQGFYHGGRAEGHGGPQELERLVPPWGSDGRCFADDWGPAVAPRAGSRGPPWPSAFLRGKKPCLTKFERPGSLSGHRQIDH